MSTLQPLNTLLNFNRSFTHGEAIIGLLKYTSTGLTLQYIVKKRVTSALMNGDLTEKDIIVIQKNIGEDMLHTHNNKRKPDRQIKYTVEGWQRIIFPVLTCLRREFDLEMDITKSTPFHTKSNSIPPASLYYSLLLSNHPYYTQFRYVTPTFISFLTFHLIYRRYHC